MNLLEILEAVLHLPEGDYAECGVWQGAVAQLIHDASAPNAGIWLFDSFKGHGEPSEFDLPQYHPRGRYANTNFELLQKRCPLATIIEGFIPETLQVASANKFRFVHIDLDHYWPTRFASEFFKIRMVPGGIIRFDDYLHGETPGATKAIDEVFGKENILTCDYRWEHNPREVSHNAE